MSCLAFLRSGCRAGLWMLCLPAWPVLAQPGGQPDGRAERLAACREVAATDALSLQAAPPAQGATPTPSALLALTRHGLVQWAPDLARITPPLPCPVDTEPSGPSLLSPDGRYAYWGDRSGHLRRADLQGGSPTLSRGVGEPPVGLALSDDGRWLLAGYARARELVLYDAALVVHRRYAAASLDGRRVSAVQGVFHAPGRRSFVVAFAELPELWEIRYDPSAEPIFDGLVHDYRMGEGLGRPGWLGVRRTPLDEPMQVLTLAPGDREVLMQPVADHPGGQGWPVDVVNLDVRRRIARVALPERPAAAMPVPAGDTTSLALIGGTRGAVYRLLARGWRLESPTPLAVAGRPVLIAGGEPGVIWLAVDPSEPGASPGVADTLVRVDLAPPRLTRYRPAPGQAILALASAGPDRLALALPDGLRLVDANSLAQVAAVPLAGVRGLLAVPVRPPPIAR